MVAEGLRRSNGLYRKGLNQIGPFPLGPGADKSPRPLSFTGESSTYGGPWVDRRNNPNQDLCISVLMSVDQNLAAAGQNYKCTLESLLKRRTTDLHCSRTFCARIGSRLEQNSGIPTSDPRL